MAETSAAVTSAVLASAFLHAGWNALAHRLPDKRVTFAWMGLAFGALAVPFVVALPVPAGAAWPYLLGSAAIHCAYDLLLIRSYRLGDFNQVYPLARGTSPLLVALIAALFVGEALTVPRALGVLVVSAGLASLVFVGGLPGREQVPAILAAVGTGVAITSYTVIDGVGVRKSGASISYAAWLMLLHSPSMVAYAAHQHGRKLWSAMRPYWLLGCVGGVFSMVAYGLVLWAQARGTLASVAALRESSVIVGAVIGAVWFHERFGLPRVVATVLVATGIVLLNLP